MLADGRGSDKFVWSEVLLNRWVTAGEKCVCTNTNTNSVWQICIERSFSIGSAGTISPTSAVKINIPAAAVKITRDLQRHLFSFVAQSHMLSRTSATDKSISKSISMEIMNFLPIFVFNTLTPGAYPYLWYKLWFSFVDELLSYADVTSDGKRYPVSGC